MIKSGTKVDYVTFRDIIDFDRKTGWFYLESVINRIRREEISYDDICERMKVKIEVHYEVDEKELIDGKAFLFTIDTS